ncbi:MAG: DNA translocase FtsK 4TM domain-containing protein, partial [Bacteroidaceae bacterium]|nr:DNA translocase FtsK 4TM domain-containing protein [Bacteroidaceae bacterium]
MATNKKASRNGKKATNGAVQQEKLTTGDFFTGFGKEEIFSFFVGLCLVLMALFMFVAFISYLLTGEADYSLLEQGADPFNKTLQYKNACGSLGAIVAYFFLNDLFGLASFIMLPYIVMLGLRLMRSFKFTLLRKFILFTLLMLWLSVFLAAFGYLFPAFEGSFIKLGGNHGINVVNILTQVVGTPGLLAVLAITAVLYLVYLSAKTIEIIRKAFRMNVLKKMNSERLKHFVGRDDEEGGDKYAYENDGAVLDGKDDKTEETKERVTSVKTARDEENENPTTVLDFDNPDETETNVPVESSYTNLATEIVDDIPNGEDDVMHVFPENTPVSTLPSEPCVDERNGIDESGLIVEVNETDKGDGDIVRGDINTPYDPKLDLEFYKYPTLDLLRKADDQGPQIDMIEQNANKDRIIHVLKNFGVEISSIKATIGPTITLYEIVPAEGTRISKIRNLEDDIALSLAAEGIRI